MEYTPDRWLLVKITGSDPHYRIFGTWGGSYTQGDSWRMNSGIVEVIEHDDFYEFFGHSGSVYKCYKHTYGVTGSSGQATLTKLCSDPLIEYLNTLPDVMKIDWIIKPRTIS